MDRGQHHVANGVDRMPAAGLQLDDADPTKLATGVFAAVAEVDGNRTRLRTCWRVLSSASSCR